MLEVCLESEDFPMKEEVAQWEADDDDQPH